MDIGLIGTGLCMSIAAIGSCIGVVIAGTTCIGAWKKCYMSNKAAPFILTSFAGAPLTQTIYGKPERQARMPWLKQERALLSTLPLWVFAKPSLCSCWYSAWLHLGSSRLTWPEGV